MDYVKGITFAPFAHRGTFETESAKQSLRIMCERTGANTVVLVPAGIQETPQSVNIDYRSVQTPGDDELEQMIRYAKRLGLKVFLKPTVNCKNGVWRAYINFFDEDVPCEPKWSEWFRAYTEFQLHYAVIAERTGCEMFIAGCEMVMTERREQEWRKLIKEIKSVYHGPVSYNTDKYQEHHVAWWDCVDVISSSGYYPADDWENQLDRIQRTVKKYQKPFFFAEVGCMSTEGSKYIPNNWELKGGVDLEGQAQWYEEAFASMEKRDWLCGAVLWSWNQELYTAEEAKVNPYYEFYQKPSERVIHRFFKER